jgi:Ca2+-binding RTX toxin-like protein
LAPSCDRDVIYGQDGADDIVGGDDHDYISGGAGDDTLDGGLGRDYLSGDAGTDRIDGGTARGSPTQQPRDHWNRLYGGGGLDTCLPGPGRGSKNTDYRDSTCELPKPGSGFLNGSRPRLDRG